MSRFECNKIFECCTILSYPLYFMTERSNTGNNQFFYCKIRKNAPKQEINCILILSVSLTKHFKNRLCPKPDILLKTARNENSDNLRLHAFSLNSIRERLQKTCFAFFNAAFSF